MTWQKTVRSDTHVTKAADSDKHTQNNQLNKQGNNWNSVPLICLKEFLINQIWLHNHTQSDTMKETHVPLEEKTYGTE